MDVNDNAIDICAGLTMFSQKDTHNRFDSDPFKCLNRTIVARIVFQWIIDLLHLKYVLRSDESNRTEIVICGFGWVIYM